MAFGCGCIATGLMVSYKVQEILVEGFRVTASEKLELRIRVEFPGLYRKVHSDVIKGHKIQEKLVEGLKVTASEKMKLRIRVAFLGLYKKGQSVVVEGFAKPVTAKCWEYCLSVTEVLAKPKKVNFVMVRNRNIIAKKLKVAKEGAKSSLSQIF